MARANGLTRQEILHAIKRQGAMTADELGKVLHISQVAVRQHLASLEAENIVYVTIERRGLGRPSHRYQLTNAGDETFPRRYDSLAQTLLDDLRSWQGDEAVMTLLGRRREQVVDQLKSWFHKKSFSAKVHELARIENEQGFMAEVIDDGPHVMRLVKHNCAVCAVARHHPEVCCAGDLAVYKQVLGDVDIVHETSILDGDHACSFRIRNCNKAVEALPTKP
jgi:DeoR family transcriptional regulator, suf operon transcriptional repressor